jgi:hypothetical protein
MYHLDHIVHFVENPKDAISFFEKLGVHVASGGEHPQWGTYNALCYFGLSYIEFIAVQNEEIFQQAAKEPYSLHQSHAIRQRRNEITRICLRTSKIEEDAKMFEQAGFDINGPHRYTRTTPSGEEIGWQLLYIGKKNSKVEYPFFIQWEVEDQQRYEQLIKNDTIKLHKAGSLTLNEICYLMDNFEPILEVCALCNVAVAIETDEKLNASVATVQLEQTKLSFYKPLGDGELWDVVMEFGIGISHIVLAGANETRAVTYENGEYHLISEEITE